MYVMCAVRTSLLLCLIMVVNRSTCASLNATHIMKLSQNRGENLRYKRIDEPHQTIENATTDLLGTAYDFKRLTDALGSLQASSCIDSILMTLNAISKREKWAYELFDASVKFPVGLLYGAHYQLGNFDECIDVIQPNISRKYTTDLIQGQYCLLNVDIPDPLVANERLSRRSSAQLHELNHARSKFNNTIYWGVCVPSKCSARDVEDVMQAILSSWLPDAKVHAHADRCYFRNKLPYTSLEIIYGCIIGIFLVFIIFATASHYMIIERRRKCKKFSVDILREQQCSITQEIVICFSLIQTIKKFLAVKPSDLNLECICGMKLFSMMFIVVGHALLFTISGPIINDGFMSQEMPKIQNAFFVNNPLLVDTFLMISGFLLSYLLIIEFDKRKGRVNFAILYIARYIRLTPSYLVMIGFYSTFLFRLGKGPLWNSRIALERDRCLTNWWTNVLYINNYVNADEMCMFQSWYLAVDYHLFIIAPFYLYLLWRKANWGKPILAIFTLVGIMVPLWNTLYYQLDPTLMAYALEVVDLSKNVYFVGAYIKTHMRASSYCIGLFTGYVVQLIQKRGYKIPNYVKTINWILSLTAGCMSMFSIVIFYTPSYQYNALQAAVYAALHRVGWCYFIGWILVACITDSSLLINKFLSWKPFIPLSRLTYCAYLANGLVELYSYGSMKSAYHMDYFELASISLSHIAFTFGIAFILCVLFESPIHGLEKILLKTFGETHSQSRRQQTDRNSATHDSSREHN